MNLKYIVLEQNVSLFREKSFDQRWKSEMRETELPPVLHYTNKCHSVKKLSQDTLAVLLHMHGYRTHIIKKIIN